MLHMRDDPDPPKGGGQGIATIKSACAIHRYDHVHGNINDRIIHARVAAAITGGLLPCAETVSDALMILAQP
jgi:hypothetical protein